MALQLNKKLKAMHFLLQLLNQIVCQAVKAFHMKTPIQPIVVLLSIILFGCVKDDDLCCGIPETSKLEGTWLLYEQGHSPGVGYITEPVPASPAQTITFSHDRVSSSVLGWEQFKYYEILNDTVVNTPFIALYVEDPGVQPSPPSSDLSTYSFDLESNTLTLYFRWCYEGCHLAFRKIR